MKHFHVVLFVFLLFAPSLKAEETKEYLWNVELQYFFNNNEFAPSSYALKQTMAGTWLNTLGGISWDESHAIFGGVNLLKIPGLQPTINKIDVTLFYQYETSRFFFRAGAFPRKDVLNYCNFFFRDSIQHFVPQMQGIFFQIGRDRNFFNAWLDWTGMPTAQQRESFYFGFSGRVSKQVFFADFQSYINHLAGTAPFHESEIGVSEQMQMMASLGLEHQTKNGFNGLVSAGVLAGNDRIRREDLRHSSIGFVARANAEFWGIGTRNTIYLGNPRMEFYERYGNVLYWQNPFLRGSSYVQSNWFIRLLETSFARAKFSYVLHFSEGVMMHQQMLTVTANVGSENVRKRENANTAFPWARIFR